MTHPQQKKEAFTLVEMSIVIVIIGIIVGSILGGRSYIRNAELNTVMNESKYYINQFNQFQSIYGAVPGDMATANLVWPGAASNGDGNGIIRAATLANTAEIFYAFAHLANASLINGSYTGATVGGVGTFDARIGTNVPNGKVIGITYIFDHPDATDGNVSGDAFYFDGLYGNVLRVAGHAASAAGLPATAFLTPKEAYQIDNKFDDGVPATGWVLPPNRTAQANCTTASGVYDTGATNGGTANCILILQMR